MRSKLLLRGQPIGILRSMQPLATPSDGASDAGHLQEEESLCPEIDPITGIDLSLIDENLRRTPWERILANDAALNLCEVLQAAMNQHDQRARSTSREAAQS